MCILCLRRLANACPQEKSRKWMELTKGNKDFVFAIHIRKNNETSPLKIGDDPEFERVFLRL